MQDNQGNAVVWMRPEILDDIIGEVEGEDPAMALQMLGAVRDTFEQEKTGDQFRDQVDALGVKGTGAEAGDVGIHFDEPMESVTAEAIVNHLLEGFGSMGVASRPGKLYSRRAELVDDKDVQNVVGFLDKQFNNDSFQSDLMDMAGMISFPEDSDKKAAYEAWLDMAAEEFKKGLKEWMSELGGEGTPAEMGWVSNRGTP